MFAWETIPNLVSGRLEAPQFFFLPLHSFGLYMKAVLTSLLATLEVFAFNPHHVVILGYCARVDLIVNVKSVNESRRREIRRFKLIFSLGLSPTKGPT